MRFVLRTALLLVVEMVAPGRSRAQQDQKPSYLRALEENPYYLRADKRLQVFLNVEPDHPKLSQIIAKLREETGLEITLADSLQSHQPDYGYIQPSNPGYHAWQIMEMVTQRDLQHGYWEKTDRGYRLLGISLAPASTGDRSPLGGYLLAVLSVSLLALSALILASSRRRKQSTIKPPATTGPSAKNLLDLTRITPHNPVQPEGKGDGDMRP